MLIPPPSFRMLMVSCQQILLQLYKELDAGTFINTGPTVVSCTPHIGMSAFLAVDLFKAFWVPISPIVKIMFVIIPSYENYDSSAHKMLLIHERSSSILVKS